MAQCATPMNDLSPDREILWLRRVRDLSHLLASEQDVRKLLPLILDAAIELADAERGFLVRVRGRKPDGGFKFKVEVARGFDKATLSGSQAHVSRTVVRRVVEREEDGLVTTDSGDKDVLDISSVQARRVLSIICVPMRLRGETRGVLYLDHRFNKDAFGERDLPILRTFADQAALALETAELSTRAAPASQPADDPSDEADALRSARQAEKRAALLREESHLGRRLRLGGLVGGSKPALRLYDEIERAGRCWDPVLILGESGAGKELVAREIHARGSFPQEPFVAEACGVLVEGSAGGGSLPGLLARVGKGTLFLDEVGELSPAVQTQLLRALRPADAPQGCRVLAASHKDLRRLVQEGRFREDLYYRLDVLRINVPPLRQRAEDIPLLLDHFMEQAGQPPLRLSPKASKLLLSYSWPGNVRELFNEARRLATLGLPTISAPHLSTEIREGRGVSRAVGDLSGKTLGDIERQMVEAAIRDCKGNKSRAARQLGIPRTTLYHLLNRYGIS